MKVPRVKKKSIVTLCAIVLMSSFAIGGYAMAESATSDTDANFDVLSQKIDGRNTYSEGSIFEGHEDLAARFPLQYNTFAIEKYRDGFPIGHSTNEGKVNGPWVRDGGGQPIRDEEGHMLVQGATWDKESGEWLLEQPKEYDAYGFATRCYACKSEKFNDLYEEYGSDAFAMVADKEMQDFIGHEIWGCGSCHEDGLNPTSEVNSQHIYFNTVIRDDGDMLSPGELVCAQCHNGSLTGACKDEQFFTEECAPWRYGYDADSLLKAALEDGFIGPDEDGIIYSYSGHYDFEFFQNSTHDSLGLDCTSCHMPTLETEDGTTFTDHDASQSPLENKASLELCLSCHKDQGIEDADAMVAMVRDKQKEAADGMQALVAKCDELEEKLRAAKTAGSIDDATFDEANDALAHATFYVGILKGGYSDYGIKMVHNPGATFDLIARGDAMVEEALALFA